MTLWLQSRRALARSGSSKFVRDAGWLFISNVVSKALMLLGNAFAARCLGPFNLGISALVQSVALQASLTCNGGFDYVAVRNIAHKPETAIEQSRVVIGTRLTIALAVSLVWVVAVLAAAPPNRRMVWLLGLPVFIGTAVNLNFVFQALERLPIQSRIGAFVSLLTAAAYFAFFKPGAQIGSDLIVAAVANCVLMGLSWTAYKRVLGVWPFRLPRWEQSKTLFQNSWKYWLLTIAVALYTTMQVPIVVYSLGPSKAGIVRSAILLAAGLELTFNSVNTLLLPRLVAWRKVGLNYMWERQKRLLLIYMAVGLPILACAVLAAPWVYTRFFGAAYSEGVHLFQLLAVSRLVVFWGQIYSWGMVANSQDKKFLTATLTGALTSILLTLLFIKSQGIMTVGYASLLSETLIVSTCYLHSRETVFAKPGVSACES